MQPKGQTRKVQLFTDHKIISKKARKGKCKRYQTVFILMVRWNY